MKRILTIATLIIMSLQTMAQRGGEPNWISIAGKVGVGNSILLSQQIKDDGNITQNYLSPSVSVGGRLGVVLQGDPFGEDKPKSDAEREAVRAVAKERRKRAFEEGRAKLKETETKGSKK